MDHAPPIFLDRRLRLATQRKTSRFASGDKTIVIERKLGRSIQDACSAPVSSDHGLS